MLDSTDSEHIAVLFASLWQMAPAAYRF